MPAGAEAKGSAFSPSSQGKMAAREPSRASTPYHTISSRRKKLGKNFMWLRSCAGRCLGVLMPAFCTSSRCRPTSPQGNNGRIITWKAKKRVSVAAPTSSPPRSRRASMGPTKGGVGANRPAGKQRQNHQVEGEEAGKRGRAHIFAAAQQARQHGTDEGRGAGHIRSEEHTSELQ